MFTSRGGAGSIVGGVVVVRGEDVNIRCQGWRC